MLCSIVTAIATRMFELNCKIVQKDKSGLNWDLNPGPPAPEAGIIPLDH